MKRKILAYITRKLLVTITEYDILVTRNRKLYLRGEELSKEQQDVLASESRILAQSRPLNLILREMKYLSNKQMFENSKTTDDMIFGKAMLYTIDIIEKKINSLSKL